MNLFFYLNDDHSYRECTCREWAEQFENMDRHVADDCINDKRVSTVWLGNNHNYFGGEPLVLETIVFDRGESVYMQRYSTWERAEKGHQEAIEWVLNGCP